MQPPCDLLRLIKFSRRLGMMREVDLDPNDHAFNDMHTSSHDMTSQFIKLYLITYLLSNITQNDNRKGEIQILFPGFGTNGKDLVIDFCIANAYCKTYTPLSCYVGCRRDRKNDKYLWHILE
jgi:hypothetical protein